jgi:hypothetical protein
MLNDYIILPFQIITMSDIQPICILHRTAKGKSDEPLKQFTEQSWVNVKEAEKLKRTFKNFTFFRYYYSRSICFTYVLPL